MAQKDHQNPDRLPRTTLPPAASSAAPLHSGWYFPRTFWVANGAELFERAAFYAMFITLGLYLSRRIGFSDVQANVVAGPFSFLLYMLPPFVGALTDKIGFRRALLLAFILLGSGYTLLGAFQLKATAIGALVLIALGGSIVKPAISGTAALCSDPERRARAFSIFYLIVNIGSFTGKSVAAPLRTHLGLEYINLYAAVMCGVAFLLIALFYRNPAPTGPKRSFDEVVRNFLQVVQNGRFMSLIIIVAGFWLIQGQLYASMPKYILRLLGESAKPEWLANINPLVVVLLVAPVTHLVRHFKPVNSIAIAMAIIPLAALCVSLSSAVQGVTGNEIRVLGGFSLHPVTLMVIVGIGLMGVAECFLSPKFMEFASKQAPEGQVALYMGFQSLSSAIAWLCGFLVSGFLLEAYCPDPDRLPPPVKTQWQQAIDTGGPLPEAYAQAHYIWYTFFGIGVAALLGLILFKYVTSKIDQHRYRVNAIIGDIVAVNSMLVEGRRHGD